MKLFAIYIGGEHPGANIELHDMRFVVAPSIEKTSAQLLRQWWGTPGTLHIDCWAEIDHVDGYAITLRPRPFTGPERLFYVNLGGYDRTEFSEKHKNVFVVAASIKDAKEKALNAGKGWADLHRDDFYEAEQAFSLNEIVAAERLHIHLTLSGEEHPLTFTCDYRPLKIQPPPDA